MKLPRYKEYKDSEGQWFGEVPEHWGAMKVKHVASRISSGKTPLGGSEVYVDDGVMFLRSQNIYDEGLRLDDVVYISEAVDETMAVSRVQYGDILLNITGASIGRSCVVPSDLPSANVNQHVCAIRMRENSNRQYVGWLFKSAQLKSQIDSVQGGAAREGSNFQQIAEMAIMLPPPQEQTTIATFLDRETAKIDGLIAEQEKLIVLLAEKRQATISHAVTKGLNPAAPMKDSGVAWLGEVPAHWEVKRIKHLITSFEQGWSPQCESFPVEDDEEWGVLKVGCVNGGVFKSYENKKLPPELDAIPELGILKGDLLISRANTRELVGNAAVAEQDYKNLLLCDKLYRLRLLRHLCSPRFLAQYLGIENVRGQIELAASGASSSMLNIGQSVILELSIALPSNGEQEAITAFLDTETARLDELTSAASHGIALLKERRSALISAAVTGKIDVREAGNAVTSLEAMAQ